MKCLTQKPTVLVIDDMPAHLMLTSALLHERYHVRVATSGAQALKIVEQALPDLILLDVMMPDMDGYEVCRRLKGDPNTRDVPVLFLSANSQDEGECLGFKLGAADYLHKPINPPVMLARVQAQLCVKATTDLLRSQNTVLIR